MARIAFNQIPNGMIERLMGIENYIKNSSLDIQLLELMRLRVAQINKCAYCIDMHYKELKHAGESDLRISMLSVWNETSFFTKKEKSVLRYTEAITEISKNEISDDIFDSLAKYFDQDEICTLSFAIVQLNTWTRLVKTFKFEAGHYEASE